MRKKVLMVVHCLSIFIVLEVILCVFNYHLFLSKNLQLNQYGIKENELEFYPISLMVSVGLALFNIFYSATIRKIEDKKIVMFALSFMSILILLISLFMPIGIKYAVLRNEKIMDYCDIQFCPFNMMVSYPKMYLCTISFYIAVGLCTINSYLSKYRSSKKYISSKKDKIDLSKTISKIFAVIVIVGLLCFIAFFTEIDYIFSIIILLFYIVFEGVVGSFIRIPVVRIIMITGIAIILGYYIYFNYIRKDNIQEKNDEKVNDEEEKKED